MLPPQKLNFDFGEENEEEEGEISFFAKNMGNTPQPNFLFFRIKRNIYTKQESSSQIVTVCFQSICRLFPI